MIYLDNSATTRHKPFCVKIAILKAFSYSANPTRSSHIASFNMALKIMNARNNLKSFFVAPNNSEVVYTYNCTQSLNTAILGTAKQNGHIVVTAFEHNSTLRPIYNLEKSHNISYNVVKPNANLEINPHDIIKAIKKDTYLVVINHVSNVTGSVTNLEIVGNYCFAHNIIFLVDSAQSAGHEKIDMTKCKINLLAVAGHKGLFGPQGIGALIINNVNINPILFGGSGTNSTSKLMPEYYPDKLEAGTINTVGIMGLNAGVNFIKRNFEQINDKTKKLTSYLIKSLQANKKALLYSNNINSGVVSFKLTNLDVNETQNLLNEKYKICVRSGLHCAPLIHEHLKTTETGLLRVSISYFNKLSDIKKFICAINELSQIES